MEELKPWDRQRGESSKAYEAFAIYRDMGSDRTVRSVAESLNKSGTLIAGWSGKHGWVARAAAWDSMPGRAVASAYEEMAREIAEDHRRVATKLLRRLEVGLDDLLPGKAPSQTWTMAHGAARQGHQFAAELTKPADTAREEISRRISALIGKLAGDDDE